MRIRTIFLIVVVGSLLLGGLFVTARAAARPGVDFFSPVGVKAFVTVKPGTASGGGYRLGAPAWQVTGTASGGGYRLQGPAGPAAVDQCCCTFLPCIKR